jgi:hypothetical protein
MKKFENSHANTSGTFPDTLAIDASGPSATDGTEYIAEGINDWWGWVQALLNFVGITPSGVTETKTASDVLDALKKLIGGKKVEPITASVAANALTITLNPTFLDFRSTTLGSGTVSHVKVPSAISLVISSGSTLGTVNAIQSRIAVLAINNAGTVELAAVNLAGGNNLDETDLISTVAEGGAGAADSKDVFYSTTLRSNVPFKVVGFIESTQATAGAWATSPSTIQGMGGEAFSAMSSIGYGQKWQVVTGSRALATTYYNTTGKPISVHVFSQISGGTQLVVNVDGVQASSVSNVSASPQNMGVNAIVPPFASYSATGGTLQTWTELR